MRARSHRWTWASMKGISRISRCLASVSGPASGGVEGGRSGEAAFLAGHEADHRGAFLDLAEAAHRDPRAHVVDLALRDLLEDRALESRRRQAVDDHPLGGELLAERLGE